MGTSVYVSLLRSDLARRSGDVQVLRGQLRELVKELQRAEADVTSLRAVLARRAPALDLDAVKPIQSTTRLTGLRHNKLTTLVLDCLREAAPEQVSKDTIVQYVANGRPDRAETRAELVMLSRCIQKTLKRLASQGTVVRHHNRWANGVGVWSLPLGTTAEGAAAR